MITGKIFTKEKMPSNRKCELIELKKIKARQKSQVQPKGNKQRTSSSFDWDPYDPTYKKYLHIGRRMSFCNICQQWSFPSWLIYIGFDFSSKMRNIFDTDSLLWWFSWHLVSSLQQISDIKPGCVLRGCNFARIEEDFSFEFTLRMAAPIFLASNSFPRLLTDLSTVSESTKRKYLPSIRWWYHAEISELTLIDLRFWKELAPSI